MLASAAPSPSHHAAKVSGASASAQALTSQLTASGAAGHVIVGHATASRSKPLREMRALPMKPGRELETLPNNPMVRVKPSFTPDAARQTRRFPNSMPNPILNFDGIGFPGVACNCAPPDTNGEVGADAVRPDGQRGLPGLRQVDRRVRPRARSIVTIWQRLRRRLPERRRRRPGRPLRPARQPLGDHPVRQATAVADRRVHRGLDDQRRDRLLQPLRLPPRQRTSSTTRTSASGPTPTTWR